MRRWLGVLVLLAACHREQPAEPPAAVVEERLIGPRTARVLGDPTNVRAYRVLHQFADDFAAVRKGKPLIDDYPILAEAAVGRSTARKISAILLDPKTYDVSYAMACLFQPHHALRFERGTDVVDVIICFECSDLAIVPAKALGEQRTMLPFGRVAKPLYAAVAEVLPETR